MMESETSVGARKDRSEIIAHCDRLGYLRCVRCHDKSGIASDHAVHADSGWSDQCDCCGQLIDTSRLRH